MSIGHLIDMGWSRLCKGRLYLPVTEVNARQVIACGSFRGGKALPVHTC